MRSELLRPRKTTSSRPSNICCRAVVQFTVMDLPSSCGGNGADSAGSGADNAAPMRTANTALEARAYTTVCLLAKAPAVENKAGRRDAQWNRMPERRKARCACAVNGSARRFRLDVNVDELRGCSLLG